MRRIKLFRLGDKGISIAVLILVIFGSLMIVSAEMGNAVGDTNYLKEITIKQSLYATVGLIAYFVTSNFKITKYKLHTYWIVYLIILFALLACRLFGQINGAYAWITIGSFATVQPSEFAKVFMIAFAGKIFSLNENVRDNFKAYAISALLYVLVIVLYQHDTGSGVVLAIICYCMAFIPNNKELKDIQIKMLFIMIGAIILAFIAMSSPVTNFLKKYASNYMVGRFLAAADPFMYQYDNGYHIIMSLVSFANGNLFGLGYGNSIHKYMNFPNPSNDFILPVIVEELGIAGFLIIVIAYGVMLYPLCKYSLSAQYMSSKIILLGVFLYFIVHFILNVGGVGGLIPLTGVPLLIISSGGSSLVASLCGLGLAQGEIIKNRDKEC